MQIKRTKTAEYVRVGINYFKVITKPDRYGIKREYLKAWNLATLKIDEGTETIGAILKYDDFVLVPDNKNYTRKYDNCYNIYYPFPHEPKEGDWKWTKILLEHVFGDQYEAGMIYLQCLYLHPQQALPVLILVSKERQTGKSTFLDWLNMVFGANMVQIEPDMIGSPYNEAYATSNIIAIDETLVEKQAAAEKIKALATKKNMLVNPKYITPFSVPFFGKIIMATNNESRFMRIEDEEIRFWVRKLTEPKHHNHNILNDMVSEIPAFLHHLETLPDIDFSKSRMVLTPEQIHNEHLTAVINESRSGLYKELEILIDEFFQENANCDYFEANLSDIITQWFMNDKNISRSYLRRVLQDEMKLEPSEVKRYRIFNNGAEGVGRVYRFDRQEVNENIDEIPF